jgi:nucleosome binding factor SPN SPT16 subunit
MTLEQCIKLGEIGFDKETKNCFVFWDSFRGSEISEDITKNALQANVDKEDLLYNPTAEEALAWVKDKLSLIYDLSFSITKKGYKIDYAYENEDEECEFLDTIYPTLSDAVYALIEWCYENKLLEA